jgi:hypothetical protein
MLGISYVTLRTNLLLHAILDDMETGYDILAALLGIDCQPQLKNHMIGLLLNGATREELAAVRDLCLGLARRLSVVFRNGLDPKPIPDFPASADV